jgi:Polymerase beta, Nucleotidyltransferase
VRDEVNPVLVRAIEELRQMVLKALGDHDAAVWLFGSCARGAPRQHSDIDIATLPRDDLSPASSPNSRPISRRALSLTMSISSTLGGRMRHWSTRCAAKV